MANENLTCNITTALANVTSACAATDLLELAIAASDNSNINRQISVAKTIDLPDLLLNDIPEGTIMFLENYNVPVVATKTSWEGLDGQLIRKDVPNYYVWAWGTNYTGQLGDKTSINKSSPISVVGGFTDWSKISTGANHIAGLRENGTIWSWGNTTAGALGNNNVFTSLTSPVSVVGGFTSWCDINASARVGIAIQTNGTAWSWGYNSRGQLGDGTTVNKSSPVSVIGGFADWCQSSGGSRHNSAMKTNGTIWAWGCNDIGQLGDGTTLDKSSPVSVIGGFTDWCQLSTKSQLNIALKSNGTIWTWGSNSSGQLGDGTIANKSSPVSIIGGFTDWNSISAGGSHALATKTNGTLWAWGSGANGRLGNGTANRCSPVSVVGGFTDWCRISAGSTHSSAIRTNGTAWAWGYNDLGQLGDNTTLSKASPISIVGGFTSWCQISAGYKFGAGIIAV